MVKFRSRKVLALLIYLAAEGGMHSREKITTLLWPESDEPQGRATLRRTLADLRTALQDSAADSHLVIEWDALGFDFASDTHIDIRAIEAAFTLLRSLKADQVQQEETRGRLLTLLQEAVKLYRGSFLEGFSLGDASDFDDWVDAQRAVWHRRMGLIFDRLSQVQTESGELAAAIDTTGRWIAYAVGGITPGCCSMPRASKSIDSSTILPSATKSSAVLWRSGKPVR